MVISTALKNIVSRERGTEFQYGFCDYLNISACPITETSTSFSVIVYNPIARFVDFYIRVPVPSNTFEVFDPKGKPVPSTIQKVSKETVFVRGDLGKAGYELTFPAKNLPPLGIAVFFVNKTVSNSVYPQKNQEKMTKEKLMKSKNDYTISNEHLQLTFDIESGRLSKIDNLVSKISLPVDQAFFWYNASVGNDVSYQASGAYIFRPNSSTALNVSANNQAKVSFLKSDILQQVHQVFSPWMSQTIRLYANKPYAEFEYTVGPIELAPNPYIGKEIISRFDTNLKTNGVFYTDANGREMQLRKRNHRPTWKYNSKYLILHGYMKFMNFTEKISIFQKN